MLSGETVTGQDILFSQYYPNTLYLNPAYAGAFGYNRLSLNYKNHWPGLRSGFVTYSGAYDQPVESLHGGIGINLFNDNLGDGTFRKISSAFIYSYHLQVTRELFLFAGFETSVNQNRLSGDNLVFEDMLDPFRGIIQPTLETFEGYQKTYVDFAVGFMGIYRELQAGLVIHHLAKPGISDHSLEENRLPRKYSVYLLHDFYLTGSRDRPGAVIMTPNLLYQQQGHYQHLRYGIAFTREPLSLAAGLRHDLRFSFSTLVLGLSFQYSDVSISYSYDMIVYGAGGELPGSGAHEIACVVGFAGMKKRNLIRAINPPRI